MKICSNTCAPPAHVKQAAVRTTMATIPLKGQPALGDDSERASPPVVEGGKQGMADFQVAQNFQDFFIAVLILGITLTASPHCCVDVPVPQVLGPIVELEESSIECIADRTCFWSSSSVSSMQVLNSRAQRSCLVR